MLKVFMRLLLLLAALSAWGKQDNDLSRHASAAAAALQAGDYLLAERENRAVLRLAPDMAEARMNLGVSLFLQKKYSAAIDSFSTALRRKPGLNNALLFLGISHFNLNEPAKALPFLQRYIREKSGDLEGQYYLGLTELALNRYADAEHSLMAAAQLEPKNIDVLYHLAQSYVGEARQSSVSKEQMAESYASTLAEIETIDPHSYRLSQLRAADYERDGDKTKAMAELESLFQKGDPHARGLHYTLGCLYMEALQYPEAQAQFQSELALDNPEPRTYLQLGHTYIALNDSQAALVALQKATVVTPDAAGVAWVEIGRTYRQLDRPKEAVAAFEKGIELGERTSNVYYQLGLEARKSGDIDRARQALTMSQKLRDEEKPPAAAARN
jgi:tetratricopeptide (TPR) repeat protein